MSDGLTTRADRPSDLRRASLTAGLTSTTIVFLTLLILIVVSAVLLASRGENLFATRNIADILTRASLLGFIAIGQTLVIVCRSLDLSVGYTVATTSLVAATVMVGEVERVWLGVAAALGVAAVIGLLNGMIVGVLGVNPFIATLGTGLVLKAVLDTRYQAPAGSVPQVFEDLGYTRIGPVPIATAAMLAVAAVAWLVLRRTRLGYHMLAVGGNTEVARLSGIHTTRTLVAAHVLCAVAAGLGGLFIAARFGTGSAQVYTLGYDLDSIAAVVLGGTLLLGGRGSIPGTIGGVLILALLDTIFNALSIDPFVKDILSGTIIIAAVALYARRRPPSAALRRRFGRRSIDTAQVATP